MKEIEVSFIIPVYNTPEDLLNRCISSICKHNTLSYEVLVIDDGSNSHIAALCDELSSTYNQLKVFHQINSGVSCARNKGLFNSIGKYIVFVDPDDYVLDDLFKSNIFSTSNTDVILFKFVRETNKCGTADFGLETDMLNIDSKEDIIRNILFLPNSFDLYVMGSIWGKAFKKDFLVGNDMSFNPSLWKSEDRIFMLYAIDKANSIEYVDIPAYVYFENAQSTCRSYRPDCYDNSARLLTEVKTFFDTTSYSTSLYNQAISKVTFIVYFEVLYHDLFNPSNKDSLYKRFKKANFIYKELNISKTLCSDSTNICIDKIELLKYELIKRHLLLLLYVLLNTFRK